MISQFLFFYFSSLFFSAIPVIALAPGSTSWATQGFYFDWNNDTLPLPSPITAQCESINVKWGRGAGIGPDPSAPYIIKIYTSTHLSSFVIDAGNTLSKSLPVPFDPGSQYVMCMTDLSGISGGCQDLYTVYPSGNTSCQNVTVPENVLGVKMTSSETGGLLSRFGWPASCTDLQFDLVDGFGGGIVGKPPYQLTVAPAFRTPLNISFESSVKWTVVLDHGHPFFVSVTDSEGTSWVNGPLHAGAGSQQCFGPSPPYPWLTLPVSLGMSFSFLILGFLLALIGVWCFANRRPIRFSSPEHNDDKAIEPYFTESRTKSTSSRGESRRDSRPRTGGSGSGPRAGGNGTLLGGLHLRRPSNNRASSSEMVLMHDRPALRRGQSSGQFDLAASPIEEHHPQLPYSNDPEGLPRHPRGANGAIIETPHVGPDERGIMPASPRYITFPPPTKHRPQVASTSSSGSPTSTAPSTDGTRLSNPSAAPSGDSTARPQNLHALPPRSNSAGTPANYTSGHQNMNSPVPIIRSHSHAHSPSNPTNVDNISYPPNGQHQNQQYQHQQNQPTHEVYVVHHDAGLAPPVTVFTRPGTVVTELPPGYENLIPNPRQDETPANNENQTSAISKAGPSISASNPTTLSLDTRGAHNRPRESGMGLVNAEDMPLSALSSTPGSSLPPRGQGTSDTRQET